MASGRLSRDMILDPAGDGGDAFGCLIGDRYPTFGRVVGAREFRLADMGGRFSNIEKEIYKINYEQNVDRILCEKNALGVVTISNLRDRGLRVIPIVTGTTERESAIRFGRRSTAKSTTLDKDTTVEWVRRFQQSGQLEISTGTEGLRQLNAQLPAYGRNRAGKWEGLGTDASGRRIHDDLVSCLIIWVHDLKRHLLGAYKRRRTNVIASKSLDGPSHDAGERKMQEIKAALARRGVRYDSLQVD